jgi:DNA-binding transcriptional LysR family regulator
MGTSVPKIDKDLLENWCGEEMDRLEAMSIIVAVTETGSFSAASRLLKIPVATVSRKVSDLETRLKAELLQRNSRQMILTDAGRAYIEACKRIIEQVDEAEREVSGEYKVPKGDLAVTSPWGLGHMHLLPLTIEFLQKYPEISLRLVMTDRVVSTTDEGIDVAIRIGVLPDSSLIATRIGSIRVVVCASPGYLQARGVPTRLSDLVNHDCITVDSLVTPTTWKFASGSRPIVTPIHSRLCVNTSEAAIQAATAGAGLARVMSYKMEAARRSGDLRIVLDEFEEEPLPVNVVYAPRKIMPLKLRTFLNWISPRLKARLTPGAERERTPKIPENSNVHS